VAKKRVLIDACAILPAFHVKEWNRLCGHFDVETVEIVVAETQAGNINRRGYVQVDEVVLRRTLKKIHPVSENDRALLAEKFMGAGLDPVDDGERDLLAHFLCYETPSPDTLLLTSADRNAIRAACILGWGDSLVSLEQLFRDCGAPDKTMRQLEKHLKQGWLVEVRTGVALGLNK
jgi:hypothetical protein